MEKELRELGLSENEAIIYLFLLKHAGITTGPIIRETGISNSRVYESINSLVSKGLVSYVVQKDGKYFSASSPEKFKQNEEERLKKIDSLIPNLNKLRDQKEFLTNTAIYEGYDGFKTAFRKIIDDCPKNQEIFILGFSEPTQKSESLRLFLSNMNLKSAKKRQKLKIVLDNSVKETLGRDREKEKNTEVRYMPKGYVSPAAIDIFEDFVYIFLWEEKPFVFMIKNKMIAESFKTYFKFLWQMAKKS
jgi:sugar-specific transcriptional regulator TrmB